ncbi:hypothetical protein [Actinomycetospora sp. CA-053990]|uniref:hypothetical protein n=1 Tax=Actinomycetospora sp. CA-053990 TaxID=3239891 RepID=UPI003D8A43C9
MVSALVSAGDLVLHALGLSSPALDVGVLAGPVPILVFTVLAGMVVVACALGAMLYGDDLHDRTSGVIDAVAALLPRGAADDYRRAMWAEAVDMENHRVTRADGEPATQADLRRDLLGHAPVQLWHSWVDAVRAVPRHTRRRRAR